MLSEDFLRIVRCPVSKEPLQPVDETLLAALNSAIAEQRLVNRPGDTLEEPLDGGLVNASRTFVYPIRGGIPNLIADDAIPLEQLEQ